MSILVPAVSGDVLSADCGVCVFVSALFRSSVSCFSCLIFFSVLWLGSGSCLTFVVLCVLLGVGGVEVDGEDVLLAGVVGVVGGVMRSMQGVDFRRKKLLSPEDCVMFLMIRLSARLL